MKPLELYLQKVRAIPDRPVLVAAFIEVDDASAWWELSVIFEASTRRGSTQDKDARHTHEVLGRRYDELLIAMPPHDLLFTGSGIEVLRDPSYPPTSPSTPRDLDGAERLCADQLARALAAALGVAVSVEPLGGPFWPWWKVLEESLRLPSR